MILPGTHFLTLTLLILGMFCWGSWANTLKWAGKWRFELFYFDFAAGVLLAAFVAALTFGSQGWDGFSFLDDLRNAGKRQDMFALVAGGVFNLANMLLVAAISASGMSVAFPVGMGLAIVVGVVWSSLLRPAGNPALLAAGCVAILAAIVFDAVASRTHSIALLAAAPEPTPAVVPLKPGKTKAAKRKSPLKGILLALGGGFLLGSFQPLVDLAASGENGLGPYSLGVVFAVGVFLSTLVFNLFFMNLPVEGKPLVIGAYFRGSVRQHVLGLLGGGLWYVGAVTALIATRAEGPAHAGPAVTFALGHGAPLIATLWGLVLWKEFTGAESKVKSFLGVTLFLFAVGLAAVSVAPLFVSR